MRPSLCETFRSRALWTWDILSKARGVGTKVGEESITDLNILELKTRHPTEIYSETFSKPQEGKNGADWEWWMTGPSGQWIGFRVQAKVLDLDSNKFSHLHYRKDSNSPFQCDLLIRKALNRPISMVPLYCLYTHWRGQNVTPWRCPSFALNPEGFGCSLLTAFSVRLLRSVSRSKTRQLRKVIPYTSPWHCLVCCRGYADSDLPHRAHSYWQNAFLAAEERLADDFEDEASADFDADLADEQALYRDVSLSAEPPSYVQSLYDGNRIERPDPNLRSITIFSEREE